MPAASDALTETPPTASIVEPAIDAYAALLTMFDESTAATLMPPAPMIACGAEVAELLTTAVICAVDTALTITAPAEWIVEAVIDACVSAACGPPNAVFDAISGSPSSASSVAKSRFDRCQP